MYNTDFPDRDDLPTPARLVRSTIMAGVSALVILVTIVLPSEYGIDPTRVGSILGLTPMGEIKVQLAQEAAAQAATPPVAAVAVSTAAFLLCPFHQMPCGSWTSGLPLWRPSWGLSMSPFRHPSPT